MKLHSLLQYYVPNYTAELELIQWCTILTKSILEFIFFIRCILHLTLQSRTSS